MFGGAIRAIRFGGVYSGAMAALCSLNHDPWPWENNMAIVTFWMGIAVPVGIAWGGLNGVLLKMAHFIPGKPYFCSAKGIGIDLLANQIGFQVLFTPALFAYLGKMGKQDPRTQSIDERKKSRNLEEYNWLDIAKYRARLIAISLGVDLFLLNRHSQSKNEKNLMLIFKSKNFALRMTWHIYLLFTFFKDIRIKPSEKH